MTTESSPANKDNHNSICPQEVVLPPLSSLFLDLSAMSVSSSMGNDISVGNDDDDDDYDGDDDDDQERRNGDQGRRQQQERGMKRSVPPSRWQTLTSTVHCLSAPRRKHSIEHLQDEDLRVPQQDRNYPSSSSYLRNSTFSCTEEDGDGRQTMRIHKHKRAVRGPSHSNNRNDDDYDDDRYRVEARRRRRLLLPVTTMIPSCSFPHPFAEENNHSRRGQVVPRKQEQIPRLPCRRASCRTSSSKQERIPAMLFSMPLMKGFDQQLKRQRQTSETSNASKSESLPKVPLRSDSFEDIDNILLNSKK